MRPSTHGLLYFDVTPDPPQVTEVSSVLPEWCYGERMRDGERGWFPASCATEITNPTAIENNVQRMKRLRKETNV